MDAGPERRPTATHVLGRLLTVSLAVVLTAGAMAEVGYLIVFDGRRDLAPVRPGTFNWPHAPAAARSAVPSPTATERALGLGRESFPTPEAIPTPTSTPVPTPTVAPLRLVPFRFGGRAYIGVAVPDSGRSFVAPFAGTVQVSLYQFIGGEVRVGSNVPSLPFFPYVTVQDGDRRMIFRPSAVGVDTELSVRDGDVVAQGDRLFRLITMGRSSWATFYNATMDYQVVVSLQALPSGRDLDPSAFIATD